MYAEEMGPDSTVWADTKSPYNSKSLINVIRSESEYSRSESRRWLSARHHAGSSCAGYLSNQDYSGGSRLLRVHDNQEQCLPVIPCVRRTSHIPAPRRIVSINLAQSTLAFPSTYYTRHSYNVSPTPTRCHPIWCRLLI